MDRRSWRIVRLAGIMVLVAVGLILSRQSDKPPAEAPARPVTAPRPSPPEATAPDAIVRDVKVRDLDGDIVFDGNVDLRPTLARIDAQERLDFRNDGSVFQNRERHLPSKPSGYYREWVHPTPGVSGPGPQRIVTGTQGEAYYTPDHYRTFERVR